MTVNSVTAQLAPYPMEELAKIRQKLRDRGQPVFDFGTGDPKIPTWQPIIQALVDHIPTVSQYPGIRGLPELRAAHARYLTRVHGVKDTTSMTILPTRGSKEAIFHIALSLVGRLGRKRIIYPDPGYPVYRSSIQFAGGIPHPVTLQASQGYLLEPWKLPEEIQQSTAAIWINYPHNPTGATAPRSYLEEMVAWGKSRDVIILSDECYVDIYDPSLAASSHPLPPSILAIDSQQSIAFFTLSKRSGMTGYRCGFMAGSPAILEKHTVARANFGVAVPDFLQHAALVAWDDENHVAQRRDIFRHRLALMTSELRGTNLDFTIPDATFYLWAPIPQSFGDDDVAFSLRLAEQGVITSPSSWLSENMRGYFRLAMVPEDEAIRESAQIMTKFLKST